MAKHARVLVFVLFLLLVLAVHTVRVARGQVAVPDFPPAAPRVLVPEDFVPDANFTSENPGALQWGAPSRFGLGRISGQAERDTGLGTTKKTNYDGYYAGLRWVTEVFTLGGEVVNLESADNDYQTDVANAAVAFPVLKQLAVGIGLDTSKTENGSATDTRSAPTLGLSVNLNDRFYIGLALGREYLHRKQGGGTDFDSDRATQAFGIGFRTGGTGTQLHLEYDVIARDAHEDQSNFKFDEQDQSHIVVELNWASLLLSGRYVDFKIDNTEGTTQIYALGWAPKKGLALLGQVELSSAEDGNGLKTDATVYTISLAYQF